MNLVIVESPTKAKTLSNYLSKDYEILASMGHIRDLPKSGLGVDIDNDFTPEYVIPDKAKKTLDQLKKSAKDANTVLFATDPDREGEAISWHLSQIVLPKKKGIKTGRVVFHELTKEAIKEAFDHIGEIDMNLVNAQQARRVLDRLVGYKLSPLLWKKVRYGLSAGRVQSVAVRLIVERERERQNFKAEEYWSVAVDFNDEKGDRLFTAELYEKSGKKISINDVKVAEQVKSDLETGKFVIEEVKATERRKNPYPPLKTSTLQQSMANVFGFSAKRTMDASQKLFEKGFITYHRTDSFNLSPQFLTSARGFISDHFGAKYLPESAQLYKTKAANAQEAHEAIRPTEVSRTPVVAKLSGDELKTYSMIWRRSLESQMEAAVYDQTSMHIISNNEYGLKANGSVIKFDGWLAVDKYLSLSEEEDDEVSRQLPIYKEGEVLVLKEVKPEQHFTQPPARYSDATLIKKLEELGIGRPSTYAPTIQTIQARGYVEKDGRYFAPADVAFVVIDLLVEHFPSIVDYGFTAGMEQDLDDIANGEKKWVPVIKEFFEPFEKTIEIKDKELTKREVTNLGETDEKCPECGKPLIVKLGKFGKFLSCSGYPDCKYLKAIEKEEDKNENGEVQQDYGECDKCHEGKMVLRAGRFGKFLACSRYPECKNAKPFLRKIGIKCPKCKDGDVIVKFAHKKKFFGCSRYPECDWSSWNLKGIEENQSESVDSATSGMKYPLGTEVKLVKKAVKTRSKKPAK
jgi:DNA topoisomerase-1